MIRVFVVDDHAVVRRGMRAFIQELPDMEVVGDAENGEEAVKELCLIRESGAFPDVILMDLMMPRMDGLVATAKIRAEYPEVQVVVMTSFGDVELVQQALEVGAAGYVLKDAEADEVSKAIRSALAGELHLDPGVARQLTQSLMAPRESGHSLSTRELEVVGLVGEGLSNRDIADRLMISERTARTHVSSILLKLDLTSRTQAALWAVREGVTKVAPASSHDQGPRSPK